MSVYLNKRHFACYLFVAISLMTRMGIRDVEMNGGEKLSHHRVDSNCTETFLWDFVMSLLKLHEDSSPIHAD